MKFKPTETIRDDRGVTRLLRVASDRFVRWWWDRNHRYWVVEIVTAAEHSLSYGAVFAFGSADLDASIRNAKVEIDADPIATQYRHY